MVGTMVLVLMGCGTAVSLACGVDTASVVGTAMAFGLSLILIHLGRQRYIMVQYKNEDTTKWKYPRFTLFTQLIFALIAPEEQRQCAGTGMAANGGANRIDLHLTV